MIEQTASLAGPARRQRRRTLTDKMVAGLKRKTRRYVIADPEMRGLYLRVPAQGPVVFAAVARDPTSQRQVWATVGGADVLSIAEARDRARDAIKRIRDGLQPFPAAPVKPDSVADVAATWLKRHVEARGLRTGVEIKRRLDVHVLPRIGDRPFADIRRGDVAKLLDAIEDRHGAWVADSVLEILRSIATWFASRNDDYQIPFVRGQRRVPEQARKRARILDDDELRAVWRTAEQNGSFGALIRLLLLSGQRRAKIAELKFADISPDGVWSIATAVREKGNPGTLKLPKAALDIIRAQPKLASNAHVFAASRGNGPLAGFTVLKRTFDAKVNKSRRDQKLPPIPNWTLHDCRRTARSLMSRAGVQSEHAERVLGHALRGVEGTYNVHDYAEEKGLALVKLTALIERIVNPPKGSVVTPMQRAKKS